VNRYCASSLQTTRMAAHAIRAGEGDVFLSVGVESVSRYAHGLANVPEAQNPLLKPGSPSGLPHLYIAMGETAENVADREGITREEMDRFAVNSQARAVRSRDDGFFDREIVPVPLPNGSVMTRDDGPRPGTTLEGLAALKPVFREDGRVTAGNACPLNDGAAATVVMSEGRAKELGITPLARILSTGVSSLAPEYMGLGPIEASRQALRRARMTIDDIDIVEINEAFAAQVIPSARALGIDHFDPAWRSAPFVRQGIFRFTRNGMYVYGFLLMWVPGLWWGSAAALAVALFNHLYIWVHYYATELPDMARIYGAARATGRSG